MWGRVSGHSGIANQISIVFNPIKACLGTVTGKQRLQQNENHREQLPFFTSCQACEHLNPDPVPEDSWNLYLLAAQKIFKLDIVESSKAFDSEYDPRRGFHSTLIHMLQETMRADSIAQSRESTFLFVDTVQSLLRATRPLMYS